MVDVRQRMSSGRWFLAAVAATVLLSCTQPSSTGPPSTSAPSTSTPTSTPASTATPTPATWRRIAPPPRWDGQTRAVWDGEEVLAFGVRQLRRRPYCEYYGLAYDPVGDSWRKLPRIPAPVGCFEGGDAVVWTGEEALLWGVTNTAYDPATDTWRKLARPPAGWGGPSVVAWTGKQMLGWGGGCCDQDLGEGAAYNPATDAWRKLPPSPLAPRHAAGAWTGSELVIAGGTARRGDSVVYFADAAAYDPTTRTWRSLPDMPVRRGGGYYLLDYQVLATDDGGAVATGGQPRVGVDVPPLARSALLDADGQGWHLTAPMSFPREGAVEAIGDGQLLVWGGVGVGDTIPPSGESYGLATDSWTTLPRAPLRARVDPTAVWTGEELIIWGGYDARRLDEFAVLRDGAALTPASP